MKKGSRAKKGKSAGGPVASIRLPKTEVLTDWRRRSWKVGDSIGAGGFGEIYLAERAEDCRGGVPPSAGYALKIEPIGNGPLFSEISFYTRCAKSETIERFQAAHHLDFLGMPHFITHGQHPRDDPKFRFMVMQRFYSNLDKKFVDNGRKFPLQTVCRLAISILDVLEYLHSLNYVHADIKGSNILCGNAQEDRVYVVDFGLAAMFTFDGQHRAYKKDPRRAHDGTIEYTSRDAHDGVSPSRRGDLEILGYVLLQWLCSRLPWEDVLTNKPAVAKEKERYMKDIPLLMRTCFPGGAAPREVEQYLTAVAKLSYEQEPNYAQLRKFFSDPMRKNGWSSSGRLEFSAAKKSPAKRKAAVPRAAAAYDDDDDDDDDDVASGKVNESTERRGRKRQAAARSRSPLGPTPRAAAAAASPSPVRRGRPAGTARKAKAAATVGPTSPAVAPSPKRPAAAVAAPRRRGVQAMAAPSGAKAKSAKKGKVSSPARSIMPTNIWGPPKNIPG